MKNNYNYTLGEMTYTIRKVNKLTQVEYAKTLNVSQSTISKIEKDFFDDVPFSLISKISTMFHVPIAYFQSGLLPIRKTKTITKTIPSIYIDNGVFQAKTIFLLLNKLQSMGFPKIYKELALPYQYLCLSNISYSYEFIDILYSLVQDKLLDAIDQFEADENLKRSKANVSSYLHSVEGFKIVGQESEQEINNTEISFNARFHELDHIYARVLLFELKYVFGIECQINKKENSNLFYLNCATA